MQRSYPLRWLALGLGLLGFQCQDSLSDDCTKTLTCPDAEQPVLDEQCIWRYSDGRSWTGGPVYDEAAKLWRWPDGKETATQTFPCTPLGIADAGSDASAAPDCRLGTVCDIPLVCDGATGRCVECLTSAECAANVAVGDAGAATACDQVRHECVPCVGDDDCSGDTPVCKADATSSSRNECVECTTDTNCGGDKPICDLTSNECTSRCTTSAQCADDKSVCNLATELCVECTDASTCSGTTSQCNTSTNQCVACIDDAACVANGRVCDTTSNNCVQCVEDRQCQNVPEASHCDVGTNICVQCLIDSQCANPDVSRCNPVSHLCVGCTDNAQCEDNLLCNVERGGVCRQCLSGSDCPVGLPACETVNGRCVECLNNAECPNADSARCETTADGPSRFTCVGCQSNGDCSGGNRNLPGLCHPVTDTCVECVESGDCSDATLARCGNGVCSACVADEDCGGRFGGLRGCVPNQGCVECTVDAHCSSTPETPVCKLANVGDAAGTEPINTCVECQDDGDCTSPTASRCVANECVACTADPAPNADNIDTSCAHVRSGATVLGVCDVSGGAPTCVQCTGSNRAACGQFVCESRAKTCSASREPLSADLCASCVSDAECEAGSRCVQQVFNGTVVGDVCLPVPVGNSCASLQPYFLAGSLPTVDSATPTAVCLLRETTCPGLNDLTSDCQGDQDCGLGVGDGLCVEVDETASQCTTPCGNNNDCGTTCELPPGVCAL
jgi:hypothetical protein